MKIESFLGFSRCSLHPHLSCSCVSTSWYHPHLIHLIRSTMADKSAYVPVEAAGTGAGNNKPRPAELDIDIDDNDYFGGKSAPAPAAAPAPPPAPAPAPAPPAPAPAAAAPKKHVYQKAKTYQKTYAGQTKK